MGENIDISGLDKADVLIALYNGSHQQGLGVLHDDPPLTKEDAEAMLKEGTYFDYLRGRVLKVELEGDTLNPWGYDRDCGEGAAAKAIESIA